MPRKATKKVAKTKIESGAEEFCGVKETPKAEPKEKLYRAEWNARVGGVVLHNSILLRKVGDEYFDKIGKFEVPSSATITEV